MAITRTLTKKSVQTAGSTRRRSGSVVKSQISSPIELISTTNMISYTSPNLPNRNSGSSSGSSPVTPGSASPKSATFPVNFFPEDPISPKFSRPDFIPPPPPTPPISAVTPIPPTPPSPLRSTSSSSRSNANRNLRQRSSGSLRHSSSSHPFGAELAKVSEIAEEYGASDLNAVEEEYLLAKGLRKYGVEEYLQEIAMLDAEISGGWL